MNGGIGTSADIVHALNMDEDLTELTVPFLWQGTEPVHDDLEAAEVMAYAFKESAKKYFPKIVGLEREKYNAIQVSHEGWNNFRNSAVVGVILLVIGIILAFISPPLGIILLIVGGVLLGVSYLHFYQGVYQGALANIAIYDARMEELVPDEQVEFISKIYIPFHIVPYSSTTSILFDTVDKGTTEKISVINMMSDKVTSGLSGLLKDVNDFNSVFKAGELLTPDGAKAAFQGLTPNDRMERKVEGRLDTIVEAVSPENWLEENLKLSIHAPNTPISTTITNMMAHEKRSSKIPSVPVKLSLVDAEDRVTKVRGAETQSLDGGLTSTVTSWMETLRVTTDLIEQRLSTSIGQGEDLNASVAGYRKVLSQVQVCPNCLEELESVEKVPMEIRYDLGEFIMDKFSASIHAMHGGEVCASCGNNISAVAQFEECPSCRKRKTVMRFLPGSAQAKAEAMVKSRIKADLKEIPMVVILGPKTLEMSGATWTCPTHGEIRLPVALSAYDEVFAHTADKVWMEMEAPIRKKAEEANIIVTQNRQKLHDQILALLPFEQDITLLNIERNRLEAIGKIADSIVTVGGRP
jgi:hypothetical protein